MGQGPRHGEPRGVLIPLDDAAAMLALMSFRRPREDESPREPVAAANVKSRP
jgi:hypothetical protein